MGSPSGRVRNWLVDGLGWTRLEKLRTTVFERARATAGRVRYLDGRLQRAELAESGRPGSPLEAANSSRAEPGYIFGLSRYEY